MCVTFANTVESKNLVEFSRLPNLTCTITNIKHKFITLFCDCALHVSGSHTAHHILHIVSYIISYHITSHHIIYYIILMLLYYIIILHKLVGCFDHSSSADPTPGMILLSSDLMLFIHLAVCLTTGPKPLPKRALHIVRSRASFFRCEYPFLSLRSSRNCLLLFPRLPVTSIPPFIFPSITCRRRQFLRKM
jgi:hypothetical protein